MVKPQTSETTPIKVWWLADAGGLPPIASPVGLTYAPGRKHHLKGIHNWDRDLAADLAALRRLGVSLLVSLLTDDDLVEYGITELAEQAAASDARCALSAGQPSSAPVSIRKAMAPHQTCSKVCCVMLSHSGCSEGVKGS